MKKLFQYLVLFLFCQSICSQVSKDTLVVGYTTAPPFIVSENGNLEGINIWLWQHVAKDLKIPFRLVPMEFSKMLDSLKKGAIDVSINPLTITSERSKEMDFTDSFFASNSTVAVAELSSFQKLYQFVQSFFSINFLKGILVLMLIILLFGFTGWYFEKRENPEHFRSGHKGIWDGLWWAAVTLTTVGYGDKAPKSRYGKIAALLLMFTGLLFISGLTAGIASSLTVNQLTTNTDSFNEFKERSVGSVKNTSTTEFLKSRFFKDIQLYNNVADGLKDLKTNDINAFMYDEPILRYRIQNDTSLENLQVLPIKFDVQFYAFGLKKNETKLEQAVSQRILEIMETQEWQVLLSEYGLTEI